MMVYNEVFCDFRQSRCMGNCSEISLNVVDLITLGSEVASAYFQMLRRTPSHSEELIIFHTGQASS